MAKPKELQPDIAILFETRPLMIFALCAMLFHFANAPLPSRWSARRLALAISQGGDVR